MSHLLKAFLWLILLGCMAVLTKNILLKNNRGISTRALIEEASAKKIWHRWNTANLKPFSTILLFYHSRKLGTGYKLGNLVGNVIGFIPLGILFPLLFRRLRMGWRTILAVFSVSLGFELLQLIFRLGIFDVDDLILNTAGGIVGYVVYWIARSIRRYTASEIARPKSLAQTVPS